MSLDYVKHIPINYETIREVNAGDRKTFERLSHYVLEKDGSIRKDVAKSLAKVYMKLKCHPRYVSTFAKSYTIPWEKIKELNLPWSKSDVINHIFYACCKCRMKPHYLYPILTVEEIRKESALDVSRMMHSVFEGIDWNVNVYNTRKFVALYFNDYDRCWEISLFLKKYVDCIGYSNNTQLHEIFQFPDINVVLKRILDCKDNDLQGKMLFVYDNIVKQKDGLYFAVDLNSSIPYDWQVECARKSSKYLTRISLYDVCKFLEWEGYPDIVQLNRDFQKSFNYSLEYAVDKIDAFIEKHEKEIFN